jgi:M6 family metalloprotease-like protein
MVDDQGDTWYQFSTGNVYIDVCYYYYEGDDIYAGGYYTDVDAYRSSGSSGGSSDSDSTNENVITNQGAGLPSDVDGVYDVDFTNGEYVKDLTEHGMYIDGCPTTDNPAVLVIPVEFSDILASSKGYNIDAIKNAFMKNGVTDYYSVYDYYYISSYGQLELDITVLDFWFKPQYNSAYYMEQVMDDNEGSEIEIGDMVVMQEALAYLDSIGMDLSKYDSDNNGTIDSVVLITTLEIDPESTLNWAFRYWNYYTKPNGEHYEYDGVYANDYLWASYQFLYEYDHSYDNVGGMNTFTYIHEFGHVLGLDDYYDTAGIRNPLNGHDIMDDMPGDQNAFSKFNLGWITTSRLIVTNGSVTITLGDFTENGDTVIIANNWDDKLGAYQEYYVIVYYTNNGLNAGNAGYFDEDCILVYHVNASLIKEDYNGDIYYNIYNNNTSASDSYGTVENLIEFVTSSDGDYMFGEGESMVTVTDDQGTVLKYTFVVNDIAEDEATLTFTKK